MTTRDGHPSAGHDRPTRLVVGITGATGAILGIRFLEALRDLGVESHLVMSEWAERTIRIETDYSVADVCALAHTYYQKGNQAAPVSSGSYPADGMVIIPCSMNTLAPLANGLADNLIHRAADVTLKEQRKLVLVPRETPLSTIHLRNMLALSEVGVSIVPPTPAFYNHPESVDEIVLHIVARVLDQFRIDNQLTRRWRVDPSLHNSTLPKSGRENGQTV
ncbi:UbiX family flavin prenyltransferase [Nocardia sp. NPDC052566]|uniref:UbiX family flavin prenyltransferase n=1 Tax=Nocardia sp. NPDC052566 TaxID=3364330 RepID=UPI0037C773D4